MSTFAQSHPTGKSRGHRKRSRRCQILSPSRYRIRCRSPIHFQIPIHSQSLNRSRYQYLNLFQIPFHFRSLIPFLSRCRFHCRYLNQILSRCHYRTPSRYQTHCQSLSHCRTRYQIQSQSRNT
jgi:hypothetical protein